MTIEEALKSVLTNDAGVAALVTGRIYPLVLPQKPTYPAMTYQTVAGAPDMTLTGESGLVKDLFQVDAYGATYAAVKGLARAIRTALNGKQFTVSTVQISSIVMKSSRDLSEPDINIFRVSMDFSILHNA